MKSHLLAAAVVVALAGCQASTTAPSIPTAATAGAAVREVSLKLPGMT